MNVYTTDRIRNVVLLGHGGCGKTSLVEAMAYLAQFTMDQEGDIDSIWIQPLLFIPFVENAVKHSFDSEHPSSVHFSFKVEENRLEFRCENTMPAVAVSNKVGGIGLANIQRRLGLLYPDRYELKQIENENRYMVTLCITL